MSRKLFTLVLTLTAAAQVALAGGLTAPAPEPEVIEVMPTEPSSMSAWLIPLIILILIALANQPSPLSDRRVKRDIRVVGRAANGMTLYQFRYIGLPMVYEGVMAQEVAQTAPEAVVHYPLGIMGVNYRKLGLEMRRVA